MGIHERVKLDMLFCLLLSEVRNCWRNSDVVGRFVVFDISHNRCRLIATIKYRWRMVYIRRILSHAEYDEKEWQNDD